MTTERSPATMRASPVGVESTSPLGFLKAVTMTQGLADSRIL
jgi:hypothetical protein